MAWANFLPLGGLVMGWAIYRIAPGPFRQLVGDIALLYLTPVVPFALAWWLAGDQLWVRFAVSLVALAAVFGVYIWRFGEAFRRFFRKPDTAV